MAIVSVTTAHAAQTPVVIENADFRYLIAADGTNIGFVDRATGIDYLSHRSPSHCALVRRSGKEFPAASARLDGGRLILRFAGSPFQAVLRVERRPAYVRFRVEGFSGGDVESLVFLNVPLTLKGTPQEPFGACAFSLNVVTRVDQMPPLQTELRAACHKKFGLVGASAAIIGVPMARMLRALKEVLLEAQEMPVCKVAGPWAREIPFNYGSYLFNAGALTESTVAEWIQMAQRLGFTQIDHMGFFRFGDFALNKAKWPDGWETFRRIVARLHASGIGSILHTYSFFIDKDSKYVTPVPDKRLDAWRSFTLAEPLTIGANEIHVNESTAGMATNSAILHIGDELVTFGSASNEPPWRFSYVRRGALGTRASSHEKGERARLLKELFGRFVANPETSLFEELAAKHAEIAEDCGFDGLYLDAIDGSSILRGADESWYWSNKFVLDIQKRLKKPIGMEMSDMRHHFWQYRTRWGAWDYPRRGHKRFIDIHADANSSQLFLPYHLGWWRFQSFDPPQTEPTYPDVIEQLGARMVGWNAGVSLIGPVDEKTLRETPLFRRAADMLRTCEELRRSQAFDEQARAKLREPGKEFALSTDAQGKPHFRRSYSEPHTTALAEPWTRSWRVTNPFGKQRVKLRIEALMSAPTPSPRADTTISAAQADWAVMAAAGVTASLELAPSATGGLWFAATNGGRVSRHRAWARWRRTLKAELSLRNHEALGLWIEGDGQGEIVAIRLQSSRVNSGVADHYIPVNFTGRRYFTLVETESTRWSDYDWNDGKWPYALYREIVDYGAIDSIEVWYQSLPPGKRVRCRIGPITPLPLRPSAVRNLSIAVNGKATTFPVRMTSGSWMECNRPDVCVLYGPKGEQLRYVTPSEPLPVLRPGRNNVRFSFGRYQGPAPRMKVTIFTYGGRIK